MATLLAEPLIRLTFWGTYYTLKWSIYYTYQAGRYLLGYETYNEYLEKQRKREETIDKIISQFEEINNPQKVMEQDL